MQDLIELEIIRESRKRIHRYQRSLARRRRARAEFERRTGVPAKLTPVSVPSLWTKWKYFDPRHCCKHARFIARGIWNKLKLGTYKCNPAIRIYIEKSNGSMREIDLFSIPDIAIGRIFFKKLLRRNEKIFLDNSYAYLRTRGAIDAVHRLSGHIERDRWFCGQFDFKNFFGSISHSDVVKSIYNNKEFLSTALERNYIQAVLEHDFIDSNTCAASRRYHGLPQGHPMSLFLANVIGHQLDKRLAVANGLSIRFADDAVVLTKSYDDAINASEIINTFSREFGISINQEKTKTVRLLSQKDPEISGISGIEFLGYNISLNGLAPAERAVHRFKVTISRILYRHLLLYPKNIGIVKDGRINENGIDWDLVRSINEIRRFMYNGHTQFEIDEFLQMKTNKIYPWRGHFAYFSLVDKGEIFRGFDGWLLYAISCAYAKRVSVLNSLGIRHSLQLRIGDFRSASWFSSSDIDFDARIPSAFLAWRVSRKLRMRHGLGIAARFGRAYGYLS